jgi:hypothetical protein
MVAHTETGTQVEGVENTVLRIFGPKRTGNKGVEKTI